MHKLSLLDCTLRDGGYVTDHQFRRDHAVAIVEHLAAAGVDIIEVGYFRTRNPAYASRRGSAVCDAAYLDALKHVADHTRLGVMVREGDIAIEDLAQLADAGVRLVRFPIAMNAVDVAAPFVAETKRLGMQVAINLVRASELSINQILRFARVTEGLGADWLYVADSNGSLLPRQVHEIVGELRVAVRTPLGFHPHDGLSMAMANALEAQRAGADIVDATLGGLGKGGNLPTELIALYLTSHGGGEFAIEQLVEATTKYIATHLGSGCLVRNENAVASALNINLDRLRQLRALAHAEGRTALEVLIQEFETRRRKSAVA
jgi:4-hydroxy 2-oxovalerate aldolase